MMAFTVSQAAELKGVWRYQGQECQSGATAQGFGEALEGNITGRLVITEKHLLVTMGLNYKYKEGYAEDSKRQLQAALDQWKQFPDSPEKRQSVQEINDALKQIEPYIAGVRCRFEETRSYTVNGSTIQSVSLVSKSDCPGAETTPKNQTDSSDFVIKGGTLRITSNQAEVDSNTCPKGDKIVSIYRRSK
jgi:hypothetical protein